MNNIKSEIEKYLIPEMILKFKEISPIHKFQYIDHINRQSGVINEEIN